MITAVDAVYQNGVFRPSTPPDLPEGTAVHLTVQSVTPAATPVKQHDPAEVYRRIKAIADMPEEPGGDPTVTGRNHDAVLYGPKGAR